MGRRRESVHGADVDGAGQINFEDLFDLGFAAVVAAALAVTLVDQEFVLVEGKDFTDAGAGSQKIAVFMGCAGANVDSDNAQQVLGGAAESRVQRRRSVR